MRIAATALIPLVACGPSAPTVCGAWRDGPELLDQRENSPAFPLPDGRLLLISGHFDNVTGAPVDSSEIVGDEVSVATGSFRNPHSVTGAGPTTMLADGRVLSGTPSPLDDEPLLPAEVWDPATGEWTTTGTQATGTGVAVTLPDGRVLVAGGIDWSVEAPLSRSELWDPETGEWELAGPMRTARTNHSMVVSGQAYVFGGMAVYPGGDALPATEVFDATAGTWSRVGDMNDPRGNLKVVALDDGRLLAAGGARRSGGYQDPVASVEIFDVSTGTWEVAAAMQRPRAQHVLVVLDDGRVLAAGGTEDDAYEGGTSAEIYDPATDQWSLTEEMRIPRQGMAAALRPDGDVLVAGGWPTGNWSSEVFTTCD